MACFVAPAVASVITTVIKKKMPGKYHFDWLVLMLWGGTVMSIADHILNGEITWYFPFFTKSFHEMLPEILAVGIPMTVTVFVFWAAAVSVSLYFERRKSEIVGTV